MATITSNIFVEDTARADVTRTHGRVRIAWGKKEFAATDIAQGDTYKICRLPAQARPFEMHFWNDRLGSPADMDTGLTPVGRPPEDAVQGPATTRDRFTNNISLFTIRIDSGGTHSRRFTNDQGSLPVDGVETIPQRMWELYEDPDDSRGEYDIIVIWNSAVAPQAGTLVWLIKYVID